MMSITSQKGLMPVPPAKKMSSPGGISCRDNPRPNGLLMVTSPLKALSRKREVKLDLGYFFMSKGMTLFDTPLVITLSVLSPLNT
jgi:hypothetical protein